MLFSDNMILISNADFRTQFNTHWATKCIIAVDETMLDKKEDSEKIKNLSTSNTTQKEAKGRDRQETEFYGKFILNGNDEEKFIFIDQEEERYWVRKVKPLAYKEQKEEFEEKLRKEIPAFLHFISNRKISVPNVGRSWFTDKQIWTPALEVLKRGNKAKIDKEIELNIIEKLKESDVDEIYMSYTDIIEMLNIRSITKAQIKDVMDKWKIEISDNTKTYKKYYMDYINDSINIGSKPAKARVFKFTREFFKIPSVASTTNQEIDEPKLPF